MKTIGTKLENAEYDIFEFCCQENGLTKSEQLRDLIKEFVNLEKEITKNELRPEPTITIVDI